MASAGRNNILLRILGNLQWLYCSFTQITDHTEMADTTNINVENDSAVSNSNKLQVISQTLNDDNSKPSDCKIAKTTIEHLPSLTGDPTGDCSNNSEAPSKIIMDHSSASTNEIIVCKEMHEITCVKVIYNKKRYDLNIENGSTIAALKKQLQTLVGVPDSMQKLMYKGLLQDKHTITEAGIQSGAKIMLVGSTLTDILSVSSLSKEDMVAASSGDSVGSGAGADSSTFSTKEPLCKQKLHRKVLDKGVPEDAMSAVGGDRHEALPATPLSGMLNRHGGKVRLTFKLESDQLWLSTKERTEKVAMGGIKAVVSEPIEGHAQYHIVGLQLGPTEASRYWLYWVPAQYVRAIKHAILGQWQLL